ncbi:MAG: hypothetical protein RH917_20055 [Lacipirellulaceae bacterium]
MIGVAVSDIVILEHYREAVTPHSPGLVNSEPQRALTYPGYEIERQEATEQEGLSTVET